MLVNFHQLALYNAKEKKAQMTENQMKDGKEIQRKPLLSAKIKKDLIDSFDFLSRSDQLELIEQLPEPEKSRLLSRR